MLTLNDLKRTDPHYSADYLRSLTKHEQEVFMWKTPKAELEFLRKDWLFWARPEQFPPAEWGQNGCFMWNIRCGRGWGKALDLDTPIPTLTGWTTMGDIQLGEKVFDENGKPCTVTFVSDVMYNHKCYDVVFSDGTVITADADHEWLTWTHPARKAYGRAKNPTIHPKVRTTDEIKKTLLQGKRGDINHSIDCHTGLQCEVQDLPIDPYVLGAWLGDGSNYSSDITCQLSDYQIIEEIEKTGLNIHEVRQPVDKCERYQVGTLPPKRDPTTGRWTGNGSLHSTLKSLNLLKNKHIPQIYLRASYSQRLELLQGLMDTDGYTEKTGNCEYCGTHKRLVDDVYELCISLGLKAVICEGNATLNGVYISKKYRVNFTPYIPVFKLKRKLERLHIEGSQAMRQKRRYITEIRECESVPVRCIQVDSVSHLFLASKSMIPTHNTRVGAETFIYAIKYCGYKHPNLVGATSEDVRDLMIEGESGILACAPDDFKPQFIPTLKKLVWPNGVTSHIYYGSEPDKGRGPQSDILWADEIAKWEKPEETFDNLLFGLRLGPDPRCIITSTPRPTKFLMDLEKRTDKQGNPSCVVTLGSTKDNYSNLSDIFISTVISKYEGTRLGRQELDGEFLDDNPDSLFKRADIDKYRVVKSHNLTKIVVAIDPAAKSSKTSDDTGIIVAGKGSDGHGYILEDCTIHGTPAEWATAGIAAYNRHRANIVVAEINNGGEMVEYTLNTIDSTIPYKSIHSSRGKEIRAEPVSSLYQQGRCHHVGFFRELEDEICEWIPNSGMKSPNRLDALVFAITELSIPTSIAPLPANFTQGYSFNSSLSVGKYKNNF